MRVVREAGHTINTCGDRTADIERNKDMPIGVPAGAGLQDEDFRFDSEDVASVARVAQGEVGFMEMLVKQFAWEHNPGTAKETLTDVLARMGRDRASRHGAVGRGARCGFPLPSWKHNRPHFFFLLGLCCPVCVWAMA